MPFAIKPIYQGMRVCGPALTVDCKPGDNLAIHAAVEQAEPGDVLVVDYKGFIEAGPFGDVLATACLAAGIVGLVIDGCVRDGPTLQRDGLSGVRARAQHEGHRQERSPGAVGVPIVCAGVAVSPGDVVVGDDDGVVVVPRAMIAGGCEAARERDDKEAAIASGSRPAPRRVDLLGLRPLLKALRA